MARPIATIDSRYEFTDGLEAVAKRADREPNHRRLTGQAITKNWR
jgi:hypothetical protein